MSDPKDNNFPVEWTLHAEDPADLLPGEAVD